MKSTIFSKEFIKNLILSKESKTLDFKLEISSSSKIARTLAAMANTEGGFLIIGISDQKKVLGIDVHEERFMIERANQEYCQPKVKLRMTDFLWIDEDFKENEEETWILIVEIQKSNEGVILYKGNTGELRHYIRIEDQTRLFAGI